MLQLWNCSVNYQDRKYESFNFELTWEMEGKKLCVNLGEGELAMGNNSISVQNSGTSLSAILSQRSFNHYKK